MNDDGKEVYTNPLELRRGEFVKKLDVPVNLVIDDVVLRRFIDANAGSQYVVLAGMSKHLVSTIVQLLMVKIDHRLRDYGLAQHSLA